MRLFGATTMRRLKIAFLIFAYLLLGSPVTEATFKLKGGGGTGGPPPVVTPSSFVTYTPTINGQAIGTAVATNSPTSWSITSCSGCTSYFAIDNAGNLTVTATGAANITVSDLDPVSFSPVVQASNAGGNGSATITATFYPDGSGAAPVGATVQQPTFFTGYAQQSIGVNASIQTNPYGGPRPPWKVAGVDYAVGYSSSVLPLIDPTTVSQTVGICRWVPSTVTLGCTNNDAGAGVTVEGYDFSLHNCVKLSFNNTVTGPIIIRNNYFKWDTNSFHSCGINLLTTGQHQSVLITNNIFDGGAAPPNNWQVVESTANSAVQVSTSNAPITVTYNAFLRMPPRAFTAGLATSTSSLVFKYNYVDGMEYPFAFVTASISGTTMCVSSFTAGTFAANSSATIVGPGVVNQTLITSTAGTCSGGDTPYQVSISQTVASEPMYVVGAHGDTILLGNTNGTWPLIEQAYNTELIRSDNIGLTAALMTWQAAYQSQGVNLLQFDHNVVVTNQSSFNNKTVGSLITQLNSGTYDAINLKDNYLDPTGVLTCQAFSSMHPSNGTISVTGNKNLLDGSTIGSSTSGSGLITLGNPTVINWTAHGLAAGESVWIRTNGTLPAAITAGQEYFVKTAGLTANTFQISATSSGGAGVDTSANSQSGVHEINAPDAPCTGHG